MENTNRLTQDSNPGRQPLHLEHLQTFDKTKTDDNEMMIKILHSFLHRSINIIITMETQKVIK